jgi:hypothetical protein
MFLTLHAYYPVKRCAGSLPNHNGSCEKRGKRNLKIHFYKETLLLNFRRILLILKPIEHLVQPITIVIPNLLIILVQFMRYRLDSLAELVYFPVTLYII